MINPETAEIRRADPESDIADWTGWFRLASSRALRRVHSESELQEVVRAAQGSVRPLGSRLSQPPLLAASKENDQLLDLSRLRGVLATEPDAVTFAAATTLDEVHGILASMGRMLPCCPGVISRQTLAGALATGTHGQGLGYGSFADTATRFRLVMADGSICDVGVNDPWFDAVKLSLGSLGIVTAITMRTVPARVFTCLKRTVSDDDLESVLRLWAEAEPYCKAWWFPQDGRVHVWLGRGATPEETARYEAAGREIVTLSDADGSLNDTVDRTLHNLRHDTNDHEEAGDQFRTLKRFRDVSDAVGDLFQLFCNGVAAPQVNLEIAIPIDRAEEVIRQLRSWHDETRPRLHYPIILRCAGSSSAWLSPSGGEPVCYFGFVVYYAEDGSISAEGLDFLAGAERLLAAAGGRPHWAKHFDPALYEWKHLYPRWKDFLDVRLVADPNAKFANRFTRNLFGLAS